MNNDTIRKFSDLMEVMTRDGKVDFSETDVLLDFMERHIKERNIDIMEFQNELYKCREDGKISVEESDKLIEKLNRLPVKLKRRKILNSISRILGIGIVIALFIGYVFGSFRNLLER